MPDTVDVGVGKPVKKQTLFIGAAAVGVFGFAYIRYTKQQKAAAAQAAANAAAQAPGTGAGSSDQIDPATGFPYGSVEDASALTSQAGYNSPLSGLGYNDTSYMYGGGPYYPGSGYPTAGGYTSNAQWAQAAESYLANTAGADPTTVGNALGKYITGGQLDSAGQAIVNQAIAFEGYPPVAGPDGFPPSIRTQPPGPPPVPTTQTTKVPNVVGQTAGTAHNLIVAAGLKPSDIDWTKGDASKHVNGQNPKAGTVVPQGSTVTYSVGTR